MMTWAELQEHVSALARKTAEDWELAGPLSLYGRGRRTPLAYDARRGLLRHLRETIEQRMFRSKVVGQYFGWEFRERGTDSAGWWRPLSCAHIASLLQMSTAAVYDAVGGVGAVKGGDASNLTPGTGGARPPESTITPQVDSEHQEAGESLRTDEKGCGANAD